MKAAEIIQGVRVRGGHLVLDGDQVRFRGVSSLMSPKLIDRLRQHKSQIIELLAEETAALNSELETLHLQIIRLRCCDVPCGKVKALARVRAGVEALAAQSVAYGGTENGWPDDGDAFADDDQITGLRHDLAELTAGAYPIPLPPGCHLLPQANFNPFQHGRLYNGAVSQ